MPAAAAAQAGLGRGRRTRRCSVVGLDGRGDDKVGTFSKGMQQRLGLGVALLGEPALVVLDEPTSALDPVGRHDVREIIRELRDRGATVFLNTHLLEEAEHVCDRVTVIDKGRSLATGTLAELIGPQAQRPAAGDRPAGRLVAAPGQLRALDRARRLAAGRGDRQPGGCRSLSAAIVALGGRVEAVIPEHQSLEDRFLELLGET